MTTTVEYPQELEPVLSQAVSMARWYYIDHKKLEDLKLLDRAIELYKHNKIEHNEIHRREDTIGVRQMV